MLREFSLRAAAIFLAAAISFAAVSIGAGAVNTETNYLRGDANGDGFVTVYDVTALQRHLAKLELLSENNLTAADIDGNGLNITDATNIQRYLAEYENVYNVGEWINIGATEPTTQPSTHWFKPGNNELPFIPN